jgi:hypothetical protein
MGDYQRLLTATRKDCIPLEASDGRVGLWSVYFADFKTRIDNQTVFDEPSICHRSAGTDLGENELEITKVVRRSILSKIGKQTQ